jgi:GTP-binding protein HflX
MSQGYPDRIIFTDTVGFIKKLPTQLVESFKSTLEEVTYADLLLHVIDCSDQNCDEKINQTKIVLDEIGAGNIEKLLIYNKIDQMPDDYPSGGESNKAFFISALRETGLEKLKDELSFRLKRFGAYKHKVS